MKLPICIYGDPVLRRTAADITPGYPGLTELVDNMFETLAYADGVGLAAPQVGLPVRVVVIDLGVLADDYPEYKDFRRAYLNARILEAGDEKVTLEEGCLSIPGIREKVARPKRVKVRYMDMDFQEREEWADGFLARVMQHEFAHLEGEMFVDSVSPLRKQMISRKLAAIARGKYSCQYKTRRRAGGRRA